MPPAITTLACDRMKSCRQAGPACACAGCAASSCSSPNPANESRRSQLRRSHVLRRAPVLAVFSSEQCVRLFVADDLLLLRVEGQGAAEARGNVPQVAESCRKMPRQRIRIELVAAANASAEVQYVGRVVLRLGLDRQLHLGIAVVLHF